ncbi:hypothetical protein [Bacteroides sp.]|uniref:hypothetical protein n=1 Tax=Bacteroides sp. TaxID=29523 RepID=UPI0026145C26|nr:hypothetical protein [Bacteroides sp.]MDD3040426.1 hypothetical protein [Bacteroides sp.]
MKKLDISYFMGKVQELPELIKPVNDTQKVKKYLNLLDLLTENYISPQHLAVPSEDWNELASFLQGLFGSSDNHPEANVFRFEARNIEIMESAARGFMRVENTLLVTDDFI